MTRHLLAAAFALAAISVDASADDQFPKSPTNKPSPKMEVRMAALDVLENACGGVMASHKNDPVIVTNDEYFTYVAARDALFAKDSKIQAFDASLANSTDQTPSKKFPICTKYFNDFATGVKAADAPLSAACNGLVQPLLKWTRENLAEYQKAGPKVGHISGLRTHLENARFAMLKTGGGPMGHCALNDRFKKAFAPFKAQFDALEAQVVAAETAKGITFVPVDNKDLGVGVSYINTKTKKPVVGEQ